MNGVNLNQFPFEYDLTWMAFFQNHEGRTYTRFGGRDDEDAESHLTKESLLNAMAKVLDLHADQAVQPPSRYEPLVESERIPEDIPTMEAMISRRNESCIHCHDVKVAELTHLRDEGDLEKDMIFTYPAPSQFGLHLNRDEHQLVDQVDVDSAADDAGLRAGDLITALDGHRVVTFADATRVLEFWNAGQQLPVTYIRDGKESETSVDLPEGWRSDADAGWRASSHVVGPSGGFWCVPVEARQRRALGLDGSDLALRVNFIHGDHAKRSGIRHGDIIVDIDGQTHDMTTRQLHAYLQLNRNWGDDIVITVRRGNRTVEIDMHLPDSPPNE